MNLKSLVKVLLVLVFIAGCKGNSSITNADIYKGTDGLIMEFIENAPPGEVFEDAIVPVGISIWNQGAYNIENGFITFSLEEDYMELNKDSLRAFGERVNWEGDMPQIRISLDSKTIERAEGEHEIITIKVKAKALERLSQIHESSILATACYSYMTRLVANACVDTDIYNTRGIVKPCEVKDQRYDSQGAPVAVSNIKAEMIPMEEPNKIRPQFLIYIQNKGNGLVIKNDAQAISDACSEKALDYSEWNVVPVNAYIGGDMVQLDCEVTESGKETKTGIIKLRDNMGVARCILEEGVEESKGAYVAPLTVELDYGYTNTISSTVVIKKPSKY